MNIVMIAVHKRSNITVGFRLIDTDSREIKDVSLDSLKSVLLDAKADIENVKLEGSRIVGTNGSLQRYPTIVNGVLYGKSPLIILFELVNNNYRVTNYLGEIVDIAESEAVRYAQTEGIANGKLVKQENGEHHISSINGTYKQDKLIADKQYGNKLVRKMKMLGAKEYSLDDKYMAKAENKDVERLVLARGVLGVQKDGCRDMMKLKEVIFPETFGVLGDSSFRNCQSLEEITIPEGVVTIPQKCFAMCKNLKHVYLPNSLRVIEKSAFYGCNKLKTMSCGPAKLNIVYGALPNGVRRVKRK